MVALLSGCAGVDTPRGDVPEKSSEQQQAENRKERFRVAREALHQAVLNGDAVGVEQALARSPSLRFAWNDKRKNALDLAVTVERPDPEIVRLLLRDGAKTDDEKAAYDRALMQAVAIKPSSSVPIIELLLAAGAEAFAPGKGLYAYHTPFGRAIRRGARPELVDAFLRSCKLDPNSPLAAEYLEEAAESTITFKQLQAYGVPLDNAAELLQKIESNGPPELLQKVLQQIQPFKEGAKRDGARAMWHAVYTCKLDRAALLLDAGMPIRQSDDIQPGTELIRTLSERCGKDDDKVDITERRNFLKKLLALGADPNAASKNQACPAWLGDCTMPELPGNIMVVDFLQGGADPYQLNPRTETPPLGLVLRQCTYVEAYQKQEPGNILALMLARRPDKRNALVRAGLNQSLSEMFGALGCLTPVDFKIADWLISYGADVNALNGRGDTNLASTMFYKDDGVYAPAAAYLLSKGAKINAVDRYGKTTALSWMLDYEKPRMERVLWLAQRGARLDMVLKMSPLPKSLRGPDREDIIARIKAASRTGRKFR